ncbi:MAG: hypothetical protein B7Z66_13930 [Chromatiales bacterium 21-64-14]|nr:MAG: hypothetical protein B7Z66_13930 [Chromatiales bacterium 21-64-14]HQU17201.1 chloride channel protein [Gammaproteobacteria bacterium]
MGWLQRIDRTPRLMILSVFLGVVGALGAQVFLWMLHTGNRFLLEWISGYHPLTVAEAHGMATAPALGHWYWLVPIATTLGGLLSGFIVYTWAPEAEGHGTDAAVKTFHRTGGRMRYRAPPIKALASAITIGSGGSGGREGPTAQIAAGVGAITGGLLKLPDDERRYLILIGMAAGLSAIFKSPLGTAFFAVEILYSGMAFEGEALIFTLVGSAVAYGLTGLFDGWTPLFMLPHGVTFGQPLDVGWFIVLAVVAGILGAILPTVFYFIRDAFHRLRVPNQVKPAIGGLALGLIGIFVPQLLSGGYGYTQFALQGGAAMSLWLLFALSIGKVLALSLTISSGGSGGVFGPSLFVGAFLGAAFAALLHAAGITGVDPSALAVVGMAAFFAGAARVPIASMLMVVEMTGGYDLIMPAMLAVTVSYLVQSFLTRNARYPTLYETQVRGPVDSPANLETYRRIVADFLKEQRVKVDIRLLDKHLDNALEGREGIPLLGGREHLISLPLRAGTPVAGEEVRALGCRDILIAGVLRGEKHLVPTGDTRLQVGDQLLVAGTREALVRFREQIAVKDKEDTIIDADGAAID